MAVPAPGPATLGQWAGAVGRPQLCADGTWEPGPKVCGRRAAGWCPAAAIRPPLLSSPCQHLRETFLRGWASAAVTLRWPRTLYPLK